MEKIFNQPTKINRSGDPLYYSNNSGVVKHGKTRKNNFSVDFMTFEERDALVSNDPESNYIPTEDLPADSFYLFELVIDQPEPEDMESLDALDPEDTEPETFNSNEFFSEKNEGPMVAKTSKNIDPSEKMYPFRKDRISWNGFQEQPGYKEKRARRIYSTKSKNPKRKNLKTKPYKPWQSKIFYEKTA